MGRNDKDNTKKNESVEQLMLQTDGTMTDNKVEVADTTLSDGKLGANAEDKGETAKRSGTDDNAESLVNVPVEDKSGMATNCPTDEERKLAIGPNTDDKRGLVTDTSSPETCTPDTSTPETCTPDTCTSDTSSPGTSTSDTSLSEFSASEISTSDTDGHKRKPGQDCSDGKSAIAEGESCMDKSLNCEGKSRLVSSNSNDDKRGTYTDEVSVKNKLKSNKNSSNDQTGMAKNSSLEDDKTLDLSGEDLEGLSSKIKNKIDLEIADNIDLMDYEDIMYEDGQEERDKRFFRIMVEASREEDDNLSEFTPEIAHNYWESPMLNSQEEKKHFRNDFKKQNDVLALLHRKRCVASKRQYKRIGQKSTSPVLNAVGFGGRRSNKLLRPNDDKDIDFIYNEITKYCNGNMGRISARKSSSQANKNKRRKKALEGSWRRGHGIRVINQKKNYSKPVTLIDEEEDDEYAGSDVFASGGSAGEPVASSVKDDCYERFLHDDEDLEHNSIYRKSNYGNNDMKLLEEELNRETSDTDSLDGGIGSAYFPRSSSKRKTRSDKMKEANALAPYYLIDDMKLFDFGADSEKTTGKFKIFHFGSEGDLNDTENNSLSSGSVGSGNSNKILAEFDMIDFLQLAQPKLLDSNRAAADLEVNDEVQTTNVAKLKGLESSHPGYIKDDAILKQIYRVSEANSDQLLPYGLDGLLHLSSPTPTVTYSSDTSQINENQALNDLPSEMDESVVINLGATIIERQEVKPEEKSNSDDPKVIQEFDEKVEVQAPLQVKESGKGLENHANSSDKIKSLLDHFQWPDDFLDNPLAESKRNEFIGNLKHIGNDLPGNNTDYVLSTQETRDVVNKVILLSEEKKMIDAMDSPVKDRVEDFEKTQIKHQDSETCNNKASSGHDIPSSNPSSQNNVNPTIDIDQGQGKPKDSGPPVNAANAATASKETLKPSPEEKSKVRLINDQKDKENPKVSELRERFSKSASLQDHIDQLTAEILAGTAESDVRDVQEKFQRMLSDLDKNRKSVNPATEGAADMKDVQQIVREKFKRIISGVKELKSLKTKFTKASDNKIDSANLIKRLNDIKNKHENQLEDGTKPEDSSNHLQADKHDLFGSESSLILDPLCSPPYINENTNKDVGNSSKAPETEKDVPSKFNNRDLKTFEEIKLPKECIRFENIPKLLPSNQSKHITPDYFRTNPELGLVALLKSNAERSYHYYSNPLSSCNLSNLRDCIKNHQSNKNNACSKDSNRFENSIFTPVSRPYYQNWLDDFDDPISIYSGSKAPRWDNSSTDNVNYLCGCKLKPPPIFDDNGTKVICPDYDGPSSSKGHISNYDSIPYFKPCLLNDSDSDYDEAPNASSKNESPNVKPSGTSANHGSPKLLRKIVFDSIIANSQAKPDNENQNPTQDTHSDEDKIDLPKNGLVFEKSADDSLEQASAGTLEDIAKMTSGITISNTSQSAVQLEKGGTTPTIQTKEVSAAASNKNQSKPPANPVRKNDKGRDKKLNKNSPKKAVHINKNDSIVGQSFINSKISANMKNSCASKPVSIAAKSIERDSSTSKEKPVASKSPLKANSAIKQKVANSKGSIKDDSISKQTVTSAKDSQKDNPTAKPISTVFKVQGKDHIASKELPTGGQASVASKVSIKDDSISKQVPEASKVLTKDDSISKQVPEASKVAKKDDSISKQMPLDSKVSLKDDCTSKQVTEASKVLTKDDSISKQVPEVSKLSTKGDCPLKQVPEASKVPKKDDSISKQVPEASKVPKKDDSISKQMPLGSKVSLKDDSTPKQVSEASKVAKKDDSSSKQVPISSKVSLKDDSTPKQLSEASKVSIKDDSTPKLVSEVCKVSLKKMPVPSKIPIKDDSSSKQITVAPKVESTTKQTSSKVSGKKDTVQITTHKKSKKGKQKNITHLENKTKKESQGHSQVKEQQNMAPPSNANEVTCNKVPERELEDVKIIIPLEGSLPVGHINEAFNDSDERYSNYEMEKMEENVSEEMMMPIYHVSQADKILEEITFSTPFSFLQESEITFDSTTEDFGNRNQSENLIQDEVYASDSFEEFESPEAVRMLEESSFTNANSDKGNSGGSAGVQCGLSFAAVLQDKSQIAHQSSSSLAGAAKPFINRAHLLDNIPKEVLRNANPHKPLSDCKDRSVRRFEERRVRQMNSRRRQDNHNVEPTVKVTVTRNFVSGQVLTSRIVNDSTRSLPDDPTVNEIATSGMKMVAASVLSAMATTLNSMTTAAECQDHAKEDICSIYEPETRGTHGISGELRVTVKIPNFLEEHINDRNRRGKQQASNTDGGDDEWSTVPKGKSFKANKNKNPNKNKGGSNHLPVVQNRYDLGSSDDPSGDDADEGDEFEDFETDLRSGIKSTSGKEPGDSVTLVDLEPDDFVEETTQTIEDQGKTSSETRKNKDVGVGSSTKSSKFDGRNPSPSTLIPIFNAVQSNVNMNLDSTNDDEGRLPKISIEGTSSLPFKFSKPTLTESDIVINKDLPYEMVFNICGNFEILPLKLKPPMNYKQNKFTNGVNSRPQNQGPPSCSNHPNQDVNEEEEQPSPPGVRLPYPPDFYCRPRSPFEYAYFFSEPVSEQLGIQILNIPPELIRPNHLQTNLKPLHYNQMVYYPDEQQRSQDFSQTPYFQNVPTPVNSGEANGPRPQQNKNEGTNQSSEMGEHYNNFPIINGQYQEPCFYNPRVSFYDNISSKEPSGSRGQKMPHWFSQSLNMETFGEANSEYGESSLKFRPVLLSEYVDVVDRTLNEETVSQRPVTPVYSPSHSHQNQQGAPAIPATPAANAFHYSLPESHESTNFYPNQQTANVNFPSRPMNPSGEDESHLLDDSEGACALPLPGDDHSQHDHHCEREAIYPKTCSKYSNYCERKPYVPNAFIKSEHHRRSYCCNDNENSDCECPYCFRNESPYETKDENYPINKEPDPEKAPPLSEMHFFNDFVTGKKFPVYILKPEFRHLYKTFNIQKNDSNQETNTQQVPNNIEPQNGFNPNPSQQNDVSQAETFIPNSSQTIANGQTAPAPGMVQEGQSNQSIGATIQKECENKVTEPEGVRELQGYSCGGQRCPQYIPCHTVNGGQQIIPQPNGEQRSVPLIPFAYVPPNRMPMQAIPCINMNGEHIPQPAIPVTNIGPMPMPLQAVSYSNVHGEQMVHQAAPCPIANGEKIPRQAIPGEQVVQQVVPSLNINNEHSPHQTGFRANLNGEPMIQQTGPYCCINGEQTVQQAVPSSNMNREQMVSFSNMNAGQMVHQAVPYTNVNVDQTVPAPNRNPGQRVPHTGTGSNANIDQVARQTMFCSNLNSQQMVQQTAAPPCPHLNGEKMGQQGSSSSNVNGEQNAQPPTTWTNINGEQFIQQVYSYSKINGEQMFQQAFPCSNIQAEPMAHQVIPSIHPNPLKPPTNINGDQVSQQAAPGLTNGGEQLPQQISICTTGEHSGAKTTAPCSNSHGEGRVPQATNSATKNVDKQISLQAPEKENIDPLPNRLGEQITPQGRSDQDGGTDNGYRKVFQGNPPHVVPFSPAQHQHQYQIPHPNVLPPMDQLYTPGPVFYADKNDAFIRQPLVNENLQRLENGEVVQSSNKPKQVYSNDVYTRQNKSLNPMMHPGTVPSNYGARLPCNHNPNGCQNMANYRRPTMYDHHYGAFYPNHRHHSPSVARTRPWNHHHINYQMCHNHNLNNAGHPHYQANPNPGSSHSVSSSNTANINNRSPSAGFEHCSGVYRPQLAKRTFANDCVSDQVNPRRRSSTTRSIAYYNSHRRGSFEAQKKAQRAKIEKKANMPPLPKGSEGSTPLDKPNPTDGSKAGESNKRTSKVNAEAAKNTGPENKAKTEKAVTQKKKRHGRKNRISARTRAERSKKAAAAAAAKNTLSKRDVSTSMSPDKSMARTSVQDSGNKTVQETDCNTENGDKASPN